MNDLEKIIINNIEKIEVSIPAKIVKLDGMYCDVKPLIDKNNIEYPVIVDVPILIFGSLNRGIRIKNQVGDIVSLIFPQNDMSKLEAFGTNGVVNSNVKFNLSNAYAMPFFIHQRGTLQQPIKDIEIIGDIKITGNVEVVGELTASTDVKTGNISLKNHTHSYYWTDGGGSDNTGTPT